MKESDARGDISYGLGVRGDTQWQLPLGPSPLTSVDTAMHRGLDMYSGAAGEGPVTCG